MTNDGGAAGGADDLKTRKEDWSQATHSKVDDVKRRQLEVRQKLDELEQREQERIAAQIAERHREQARAEALERKKQRDAMLRAEEERRKAMGEELKKHQDALAKSKDDAKDALKAATAQFNLKAQLDSEARDKTSTMKAMSGAMQQVGLTSSKCQHECRMKFSAVKVCEMRLAMRESRPLEEAFRDEVDEALEKELSVLNYARCELQQRAEEGVQVTKEIRDVQSLLTTGVSRENVRTRLTKSSSLPNIVAHLSPMEPKDLLRKGMDLVTRAQEIDERCSVALEKTKAQCDQATERVRAGFHKRSSDTEELKKHLERHKRQVTATISQAERRLAMLKLRSHRTPETPRSAESTQAEMKAVEELISDLRNGKRNLEEDYRNKTNSFKVDKSCMGLTKVRAGGHTSKSKMLSPNSSMSLSPSHGALGVGF